MGKWKNLSTQSKFLIFVTSGLIASGLFVCGAGVYTILNKKSSNVDLSSLSFEQVVNLLYGSIKISPKELAKEYTATEENFPINNFNEILFNNFPKSQEGIDVKVKEVKKYDPDQGEITIVINYSRDGESIDKEYLIEGFAIEVKSFDEIIDELYSDVQILLTPKGEELTASKDTWTISMINQQYFYGLPTKQEGISVNVISIETNELACLMEIKYEFSRDNDVTTRTYTVTGFKKPESLWDIVNELYPNIKITPKEDSKKLTATEENWPIEKITDEYFNGLPKSKEGIIVTIKSLSYLPEDGCLFVDFQYSKGEQSIERTYIIEGFQKLV